MTVFVALKVAARFTHQARARYTPAENVAISLMISDPEATVDELIRMVKGHDMESLFDEVSRDDVPTKEVLEALDRFAPRPVTGGDIKVYHATDRSTANSLLKRGLVPETKPRPMTDDFEFAPGVGIDIGLYVGLSPRDVNGYGHVILEVVVPKKFLEVPTESAQLGVTDPMQALKQHDGAIINHRLPADVFREVPDKLASIHHACGCGGGDHEGHDWSSVADDQEDDTSKVVLAKYQEKKEVDSINGGKTTVYVYSERQIANRNREKAKRLKKLSGSIKKLRAQVDKDLDSKDPATALTALAVALMDETAERIGSEASAAGELNHKGDGHYGVSTWQKRHVTFSGGKAHLKYTGKSGVKHDKTLNNSKVVKALKKAHESCKEGGIFCYEGGKITASKVNEYLKPFDISAKDIRGLHANVGVRAMLESIRSKGGKLPEDKKEKEKKLKEEWKEAIELIAEEVGHTSGTLKNQYLTPGLEDSYLKDGSVPSLTDI